MDTTNQSQQAVQTFVTVPPAQAPKQIAQPEQLHRVNLQEFFLWGKLASSSESTL